MNTSNTLARFLRNLVIVLVIFSPTVPQTRAADNEIDYVQKLSVAHLFLQPLVWVGTNAPDVEESHALYDAAGLDPDHLSTDRIGSMEAFINDYPNSGWVPSLRANLAAYYRTLGRYSVALDYWQKAWDATKDSNDSNSRKVADYALAYWTGLLSSLGRIEKLQELSGSVNGRALSTADFQQRFNAACRSISIMTGQPGESFKCGSVALLNVARTLDPKGNFSAIAEMASPSTGFSLGQLMDLSSQYHLGLVAAKRTSGNDLVVPSIIHWKESHYAAVIGREGTGYRVVDPTFGRPQWLSAGVINENVSGYFLIPTNQLSAHWQIVTEEEAKTIFGKGVYNGGSVPSGPPCPGGNPVCPTCPTACPAGSRGGGGNNSGQGGGGGGNNNPGKGCMDCSGSGSGNSFMPDWEVQEPYISLWLHDRPLFYNTSFGGQSFLQMDYHQREDEDGRYAQSFGDFGPNWNCNLLTYIRIDGVVTNGTETITSCDDTGTNCSIDSEAVSIGQIVATEFSPDGGQRVYAWGSTSTDTTLDPRTHVAFVPAVTNIWFTNSSSHYSFIGYVKHYLSNTLVYPNGGVATFGQIISVSAFPEERIALLTSATDPQGRIMTYSYTTSGGQTVLSQVVDFDGRTNQFIYGNVGFPTSVTEVTNTSYHLGANYLYDGNGRLTNITDMAGISSSFEYTFTNEMYYTNFDGSGHPISLGTNPAWLLTKLKTPYGTTTFDYFHPTWSLVGSNGVDNSINRAITVTQPDSGKHLFIYQDTSPYSAVNFPQQSGSMPDDYQANYNIWSGSCNSEELLHANSFYWGPRQYAALTTTVLTNLNADDFTAARMRNWLRSDPESTVLVGQTLNVEQSFSPGKNGIGEQIPGVSQWFGYEGRPAGFFAANYLESTNDGLPISSGYTLDAGHNTAYYENTTRNSNGYPTKVVDFGRSWNQDISLKTNYYIYSSDNLDVVKHIGPDGIVQEGYAYDGFHEVVAMTNALREVTKYTYNTKGQVTSVTRPNSLVTTNIYGTDGFLATTYDYSGSTFYRTNSYTYTNGLMRTHTDDRGLTTVNTWNALQKLARVDYPDGTSINYIYRNLDLVGTEDRMGFTNSYAYDNMERKIAETNALGNKTFYTYCTCGALEAIQDALGNATQLYYDAAGRLTNTVFADGLSIERAYNTADMLISTMSSSGKNIDYYYDGLKRKIGMNGRGDVIGQPTLAMYNYDVNDLMTVETNANGVGVTMTYDPLHRLRTRTYPDGGLEAYGYTANVSAMTSYTNQLKNIWTYAYDLLRRKTNEIALGIYTNAFVYDAAGDQLTLMDGNGQNTFWKYDIFGRVTNKADNLGSNLFFYGYDADDRLTNRVSAAKGSTAYSYDNVGNLTLINYPVSPDITLKYDALNRPTNMVDAVGTTKYSYDAASQVLSEDGPWDNDTVSYAYANRLRTGLSVAAPNASAWTQSYGYDQLDRLTSVTSSAGTFGYDYGWNVSLGETDPGNLVRKIGLPAGPSFARAYITNHYDSVGRMAGTYLRNGSDVDLDKEEYVYNVGGQRTQQVFTAGNYVNYTYDNIGELKTAYGKEPSGTTNRMQEQLGYAYDPAGNLNYRTNNTLLQKFKVNSLNELTTVTNGGRLTVAGTTTSLATNVTVNTSNAILYLDATFASTNQPWSYGGDTYTANAKDTYGRIASDSISVTLDGTNNYAYDLNGNMLTNGARLMEYDDENQLIRITQANIWKSEFTYDGKMRRRIRKEYTWNGSSWTQTTEVRYVYDGNLVIQERDGNNLPQVTYTRGNDLGGELAGAGGIGGLLARTDVGMWMGNSGLAHTFYHADGNGNISAMIYTNQFIAAKYEYDPFGNILSKTGPLGDANLYRFSSKEWHSASGLIHYLYRYFDPNLQRWLNRDPLGDEAFQKPSAIHSTRERINRNLYWFVMNNPIRYWDYLGLDNPGCDEPADKLTHCPDPNKKDCRLRTCAQHDKCYHDNNCTSASWFTTWLMNWLDGLITTPCQNCNNDAVGGFYKCELGGPSKGPRWYCAKNDTFYDDYSQIPASCWENGTKPPAP